MTWFEIVQLHALYVLYFLSNMSLNKGLLKVDCSSRVSLFQSILPLFIGLLIYLRVFKGNTLKLILHCSLVLLLHLTKFFFDLLNHNIKCNSFFSRRCSKLNRQDLLCKSFTPGELINLNP